MRQGFGRALLVLAVVGAVPGCLQAEAPPGPQLAITVAPLSLPGVTNARYRLTVVNADDEIVWQRTIDADAHGDGLGSISYVGPCDAQLNPNEVQLEVEALEVNGAPLTAGVDYFNPAPLGAPLRQPAVCQADADAAVGFELTLARAAQQGFFDVAVQFEDLFCSAKLDCEAQGPGGPLELLFNPHTGLRDQTAVLAFACTAGPDAAATWLHLDDLALRCADDATFTVDPTLGPGNLNPFFPGPPNTSQLLFQAAVYRGEEPLAGAKKAYWNVALGLNSAAFAALGPCTLEARATATDGPLPGGATRAGAVWPTLHWSRELVDASGALRCTHHAVGDGTGVAVAYTTTAGTTFDASFAASAGTVTRHTAPAFPGGLETPSSPALPGAHTIDGLFTGYPTSPHEWLGAAPLAGPSAERFYFDYSTGAVLAGILEGFTCPAALDADEGVRLAIATDNGAVGWQLYITAGGGLVSALRNGVDVTADGLAQGALAFAASPASPGAPHYMLEFSVPAGPGGFSYRVVGADAACDLPDADLIVYGVCVPGGGVWPPLPGQPRAGTPPLGAVAAGDLVTLPGRYPTPPTVTVGGVAATPVYVDGQTLVVRIPEGTPAGGVEVRVTDASGGVTSHTTWVGGAGGGYVAQPSVAVGAVDGAFTGAGAGGGGVWFEWGGSQPVRGTRSHICGCGMYEALPCMMVDWHGGSFGPGADKLIVYGGTPDGQRLAVIGHPDGTVEAWYNGLPFAGTVGQLTQSYSPWTGASSIVLEACLPLPWTEYVLGVTGPCGGALCDDDVAVDVQAFDGGAYTVQSATTAPRIVMVGPGASPLGAAMSTGNLGTAGSGVFVARGAGLGATAGTARFTGATAGPTGLSWSPTGVSGTLPDLATSGPMTLRTAAAVDTPAVSVTLRIPTLAETCGNGVLNVASGEACDDGDLIGGDGCSALCAIEAPPGTLDLSVTQLLSGTGRTCADAISYSVVALTATTATVTPTPAAGCLAPGDELLLLNAQGTLSSVVNVGQFELLTVAGVSGAVVTFSAPKVRAYGSAAGGDAGVGIGAGQQKVVLQRVPHYPSVHIPASLTVTVGAWNGLTGGVLALRADALTVEGALVAGNLGYREGYYSRDDASCSDSVASERGESIDSPPFVTTTTSYGAPGGYAAVYGSSFWSTSDVGSAPGHATAGGYGRTNTGRTPAAGGGTYGVADGSRLTFGSGDAGAYSCWGGGGPGLAAGGNENGGGIVALWVAGTLSVRPTGAISADGFGFPSTGFWGAGAGGYVRLEAATLDLGTDRVTARGGTNVSQYGSYHAAPAGAGYVALRYYDTVVGTSSPAGFAALVMP